MPRKIKIVALIFLSQLCLCAFAERDARSRAPATSSGSTGQKPETLSGLTLVPITDQNRKTHIFHIPRQERAPKDIIFHHTVPENLKDYSSWVLEVRDPSRSLRYQGLYDGELPRVLHWDGFFNRDSAIQINQKYFARLLIITKNKKIYASPWSFFSTKSQSEYDGTKIGSNYLKLYISPTAAFHDVMLQTKDFKTSIAPNILGDLRLIKEDHTFGVRFEVTANLLLDYSSQLMPDSFFYSDISLFYRYRLIGAPPHAPILPLNPPYDNLRPPPVGASTYGRSTNLELGVRFFNTTLRGFANTPINSELAQTATGFAATLDFDQALWVFRLYINGELGYSALQGALTIEKAESSLTFDRLENFSPGIQVRYLSMSGVPVGSSNSVQDTMIFAGVVFFFKL